MAEATTAVIFLDRNGFLIYSGTQHKVFQFNFALDVVRDLEVINSDLLNTQIAAFFVQAGLKPFQGAILLSDNLLFEKQAEGPQEQSAQELKVFLDNLPFEHVSQIEYLGEKSLFVATNTDLYMLLIAAFEKQQATFQAVLPAFVLGIQANNILGLNDQTASDLYRRSLSVSQYNFLNDHTPQNPQIVEDVKSAKPQVAVEAKPQQDNSDRKRLFILVGVFIFLIIILILAAVFML